MSFIKRILSTLITAVLLVGIVTGCGNSTEGDVSSNAEESQTSTPVSGERSEKDEITIAVAFGDQTEGQATMRASYEDYAKELGINFIYTNAEATLNKQISDVESLMVQNPNVMIIHAIDSDGIVPIAEEVQSMGIPVVDGLYGMNTDNIACHCVASMQHRGRMQAELLLEYLEKNPDTVLNVGWINGTANSQTQDIIDAFRETIDPAVSSGKVKIVAQQNADHMSDKATAIAEDWIQAFPEINCIVADSDEMALAALNAYAGAGYELDPEKFVIIGADLTARAKTEIENGRMYGTVQNDFNALARIILDVALQINDGDTVEKEVDMAAAGFMKKVTKENLPQ